MLIGREQEQEMLHIAYESDSSQFVAVYGRRRVGKTYLVRECFADKFVFQHSGVAKASTKLQLRYFKESLLKSGFHKARLPKDWIEAFSMLEQFSFHNGDGHKLQPNQKRAMEHKKPLIKFQQPRNWRGFATM